MQGVVEYFVIILLQIYWRISERIFEKRLKSEGITAKSLVFPFLGDSVLTCVSCWVMRSLTLAVHVVKITSVTKVGVRVDNSEAVHVVEKSLIATCLLDSLLCM